MVTTHKHTHLWMRWPPFIGPHVCVHSLNLFSCAKMTRYLYPHPTAVHHQQEEEEEDGAREIPDHHHQKKKNLPRIYILVRSSTSGSGQNANRTETYIPACIERDPRRKTRVKETTASEKRVLMYALGDGLHATHTCSSVSIRTAQQLTQLCSVGELWALLSTVVLLLIYVSAAAAATKGRVSRAGTARRGITH